MILKIRAKYLILCTSSQLSPTAPGWKTPFLNVFCSVVGSRILKDWHRNPKTECINHLFGNAILSSRIIIEDSFPLRSKQRRDEAVLLTRKQSPLHNQIYDWNFQKHFCQFWIPVFTKTKQIQFFTLTALLCAIHQARNKVASKGKL